MYPTLPVCSLPEMRHAETMAFDTGCSEMELMERAANKIAEEVRATVPAGSVVIIVAGSGNNGGDGLAVARLIYAEYSVKIFTVHGRKVSGAYEEQKKLLKKTPLQLTEVKDVPDIHAEFRSAKIVIEAVLGIGHSGELEGEFSLVASSLSAVSEKVWSIDVPLGVCGDTGNVVKGAIHAARTLCIQWAKRGLFQYPAFEHVGQISVLDIGLIGEPYFSLTGSSKAAPVLRAPDVHKGALGKVLIVGGGPGMEGAAYLSALAALKAGAGLVGKVSLDNQAKFLPLPEAISHTLVGKNLNARYEALLEIIARYDVIVLGPGASLTDEIFDFFGMLFEWLIETGKPAVLDADALNALAQYKRKEQHFRFIDAVLTPHPGEAARLLGCESTDIQNDRFKAVACLQAEFGGVAVLKGAGTLLQGEDAGFINQTGSPYLACPGSGDVLAGIIAAQYAYGLGQGKSSNTAEDAAVAGVWFHGLAGALASRESGGVILASEIAYALPKVMNCNSRSPLGAVHVARLP